MKTEFVTYEIALELKELGFDEPCFNRFYTKPQSKMFGVDEKGRNYPIKNTSKKLYTMGEHFVLNINNAITAPLYQQAFRFFRDKYELYYTIEGSIKEGFQYFVYTYEYEIKSEELFNTYEKTELVCLVKLIEIVHQLCLVLK